MFTTLGLYPMVENPVDKTALPSSIRSLRKVENSEVHIPHRFEQKW